MGKISTIKDTGKRPDSLDRIAFVNAGSADPDGDGEASGLVSEPGCFVELRK